MAGLATAVRELQASPVLRMLLVKWAVCAGLLSGMALAPRLWSGSRAFPTVQAIQNLPELPQPLTMLLAGLLVLSILLAAIGQKPRIPLLAVLATAILLVLFDINRLQPWVYQYLLM